MAKRKTEPAPTTQDDPNPEPAALKAADAILEPDDDIEPAPAADPAPAPAAAHDDEPEAEAKPTGDPKRDDITKRYRELRAKGQAPAPVADDGEAEAEAEPPAAAEPPPAPATAAPDPNAEITVVVDGTPVTVKRADYAVPGASDEQIKVIARLTLASHKRLEEANRLKDELRSQTREPEAQPEAPSDQEPDPAQPSQPTAQLTEKLRGIVERLQVGDTEDGEQALAEFTETLKAELTAAGNGNPEQVATLVQQALFQHQTKLESDAALAKFQANFASLVADKHFQGVVWAETIDQLRSDLKSVGMSDADIAKLTKPEDLGRAHRFFRTQGHQLRDFDTLLTDVGNTLSAKFGIRPGSPPAPKPGNGTPAANRATQPGADAQARIERKRAAPQQPRTAGGRMPPPQQPRPKTRAEIIAEMQAQRGFTR